MSAHRHRQKWFGFLTACAIVAVGPFLPGGSARLAKLMSDPPVSYGPLPRWQPKYVGAGQPTYATSGERRYSVGPDGIVYQIDPPATSVVVWPDAGPTTQGWVASE